MISRVTIENFKSIGSPGVDLEIRPLTLLVGPNGAGKSTVLEAIGLAAQQGIEGRLVSFPSWSSILHGSSREAGKINLRFEDVSTSNDSIEYELGFNESGDSEIKSFSNTRELRKPVDYEFYSKTFLIPSVRGAVDYYANAGSHPNGVGKHGEQLIPLLGLLFGDPQFEGIAKSVKHWASRFRLPELGAGFRGSNRIGSDYLDPTSNTPLELAYSSSGSRQILTVIAELFWVAQGSLIMVEEPEISLHPKAQIDVLEMFAEAIRKDRKQIIATTHSLILMQALGYAVHKGWLEARDIIVYHLENGKHGTKAKLLPLGKQGYIKGWVPSYSIVERQLLREWAKTLPRE